MRKAFVLSLFFFFFLTSKSFAQGVNLSIYPPIIEVQTTAPSSPTVPITITNNGQEEVNLNIELIPFKQNGPSGQIQLVPEMASKGFYPIIKDKIQFILEGKKVSSVDLQPLESKEIELNINLSKGDPKGDYYYSIVFINNGESLNQTSLASLPTGIATNLLLSIGPKEAASGGIKTFTTSFFKSSGPVDFKLEVHNGSSNLIEPTGSVTITNIFGQKAGEVEILPQYILTTSDRFLEDTLASNSAVMQTNLDNTPKVQWHEKFLLGLYKATARISLSPNSQPITASLYFLAFPTYFFFGIFIALFIILSIYLKVKKKI